jgi:ferric-dicitrate binding protein FerR (iron transport regulator)
MWIAAAASVLALVAGLWFIQTRPVTAGPVLAQVDRLSGAVTLGEPSPVTWLSGDRWRPAVSKQPLRARETLQTGADGRAALTVARSISLRLDHHTRIAFIDSRRIEVLSGAVYVDSGIAPGARRELFLVTPAGAVRHVGTQYEVRLVSGGTRIRVREGRVELSGSTGSSEQLSAGEQLFVARDGGHRREPALAHGDDWSWIGEVAAPFEIEGRPLREFLDWFARETGSSIVFADPQAETEAATAVLHGSISGLRPDEALQVVLPTTRLRGTLRDGNLLIEMP